MAAPKDQPQPHAAPPPRRKKAPHIPVAQFRPVATDKQFRELRRTLQAAKDANASTHARGNNQNNQNANNKPDAGNTSHAANGAAVRAHRSARLPLFLVPHLGLDQVALLAVTVLFAEQCFVLDLTKLPLKLLSELLTHLSTRAFELVLPTSGALSAINYTLARADMPTHADAPHVYDVQLGFELLTDLLSHNFQAIAADLHVVAHPEPRPTDQPDDRHLGQLARRAHNLREMHDALRRRMSADLQSRWLLASTAVADRLLGAAVSRRTLHTGLVPHNAIGFHSRSRVRQTAQLLREARSDADAALSLRGAQGELRRLLDLLPAAWADAIPMDDMHDLVDVQLDVGRAPFAYFRHGPKLLLSGDRACVVSMEHVNTVVDAVTGRDADNRAGIDGTLHRVSLMASRDGEAVGVTMRVGRHMYGTAAIIQDVLLGHAHAQSSVLLLGPPGSGKTTMGRDAARMLAEDLRVIIVDCSDEMGGCGLVPHASIGDARRMSVGGGKRGMAGALLEAVQNHTPDVVIVDELGARDEVAGAATARHRGVRMVASAHGDLRGLVKNGALRALVGGVETVTVGDRACGADVSGKVRSVRASDAVFDVIVEMGVVRGEASAVRVIHDVHAAVDDIVSGRSYMSELRWRDGDEIVARPWLA